jgi:Transposase Tn5 dimerisation domain
MAVSTGLSTGWAHREMRGARLDTPRRLPNLIRICEKLGQHAGKSLSAALGDATRQAAFDLFSRAKRTPADLIAGHVQETAKRSVRFQEMGPIVVVQDTVRLDYFRHRACQGLGPVGNSRDSYGLFGHGALALRGDGQPLGVLALSFWARDPEAYGNRHQRKALALEEKETHIWSATTQAVEAALPAEVPMILVQDRGADLYGFLAQPRRPNTQFVVRAYQSRKVQVLQEFPEGSEPGEVAELAGSVEGPLGTWGPCVALPDAWVNAPVRVAQRSVLVPATPATPKRPAKPEREAVVEIRSARVRLFRSPKMKAEADLPESIDLWAVWVRELSPPEGEAGLCWLLLTSLRASTAEQVETVVAIYRLRWRVEELHRVLKSGLKVEAFQIDDAASLMNALAICFVVAWRILALTQQVRTTPEAPASEWLSQSECEVLTAKFGKPPTTLREALRRVAQFGGWPGATKKMEPGTGVLWRGLRELAVAVEIWDLAKATYSP